MNNVCGFSLGYYVKHSKHSMSLTIFIYFISDYSSTMTTEKKYFGILLLIFLEKQWNEFMLAIYAMDHLSKKASTMTCIPTNIG